MCTLQKYSMTHYHNHRGIFSKQMQTQVFQSDFKEECKKKKAGQHISLISYYIIASVCLH